MDIIDICEVMLQIYDTEIEKLSLILGVAIKNRRCDWLFTPFLLNVLELLASL